MYDAPGARVEKVAVRVFETGAPVVVENQVGFGVKVNQLDRYTSPTSAAASEVAVGETFTQFVKGVHEYTLENRVGETPAGADLTAVAVGARLWIDPANDTVHAASAIGRLPLGIVQEVDASRTPAVARVNIDTLHAFMAA